jgi:hypothetical protein
MNRWLLAIAVVVAGAVVWWTLHKPAAPAPEPEVATPVTSAASSTPSAPTVTPAPSLPGGEQRLESPPAGSEYMVGDVRVRDHRSGSNAPMDVPPNLHPANSRELPSQLTQVVAQKVRVVLADCTKDISKDQRGPKPRLEGQLIVSIKDHQLAVTSATMQLRDLPADQTAATKQCVETHSVGLDTPAPDQDDLDKYPINVAFAVL